MKNIALDYFSDNLNWRQKLYLKLFPTALLKRTYFPRGNSKSLTNLSCLLEDLKQKAKTPEEKQYYEQMQIEIAKFHVGLTLGYWQ